MTSARASGRCSSGRGWIEPSLSRPESEVAGTRPQRRWPSPVRSRRGRPRAAGACRPTVRCWLDAASRWSCCCWPSVSKAARWTRCTGLPRSSSSAERWPPPSSATRRASVLAAAGAPRGRSCVVDDDLTPLASTLVGSRCGRIAAASSSLDGELEQMPRPVPASRPDARSVDGVDTRVLRGARLGDARARGAGRRSARVFEAATKYAPIFGILGARAGPHPGDAEPD